jgi:hypothetical protein
MPRMNTFLDAPEAWIRRAATAAYCVATAAAAIAWTANGSLDALRRGDWFVPLATLPIALLVWWIVAGIGLRVVRSVAERRDRGSAHARR